MRSFGLESDRVSLAVTETGGHLSDVVFSLADGRRVSPMHIAPWANEQLPYDTPPILRVLRGDFFCAPFGASDLLEDMPFVHGLPASGTWRLETSRRMSQNRGASLDALLEGTVMGATVRKHVALRPGETVVYQRHTLSGGSGRLPIGHHAMLRADHELQLTFSKWHKALTTPRPDETPPAGRSLLRNDQTITDLSRAERMDGGTVDLTRFPTPDGYESILMLLSDRAPGLAWTAATCADERWVWFSLKDPRVLPQTLIWLSNGGRDYAPWNGRHRRVIGLEEICGYFHLGHAVSISDNPVAAFGSPTAVALSPDSPLVVSTLFCLTEMPDGFGAVADIARTAGGVSLADAQGMSFFVPCDPSFVTG